MPCSHSSSAVKIEAWHLHSENLIWTRFSAWVDVKRTMQRSHWWLGISVRNTYDELFDELIVHGQFVLVPPKILLLCLVEWPMKLLRYTGQASRESIRSYIFRTLMSFQPVRVTLTHTQTWGSVYPSVWHAHKSCPWEVALCYENNAGGAWATSHAITPNRALYSAAGGEPPPADQSALITCIGSIFLDVDHDSTLLEGFHMIARPATPRHKLCARIDCQNNFRGHRNLDLSRRHYSDALNKGCVALRRSQNIDRHGRSSSSLPNQDVYLQQCQARCWCIPMRCGWYISLERLPIGDFTILIIFRRFLLWW